MASTRVQWRRGNTAQTAVFTGAVAEITVDTDKNVVVVHDGITTGGFPAPTLSFTQAAFDKANLASSNGSISGDYANAAFIQANAAFVVANTPSHVANSSAVYANGAFIQSNAAFDHANAAYNSQNVTGTYANSAYNWANTAYDAASNAYNFVTSVNVYAHGAFTQANAAFDTANSAGNYANGAFVQANAAYNHANTRYSSSGGTISGDVSITGNNTPTTDNVYTLGTETLRWKSLYVGPGSVYIGNTILNEVQSTLVISGITDIILPSSNLPSSVVVSNAANSAGEYANAAFIQANASFLQANTPSHVANSASEYANGAFVQANAAFDQSNNYVWPAANSAGNYANSAYAQANTATSDAANADSKAVTAGNYANSAYNQANTATNDAAGASSYANGAFAQANAAFNKANTSLQNSGVNSITSGSLSITNTGGTALSVTGNVIFNNDLTVTGNLIITGNLTSFSANDIVINDTIIYVANNNSGNVADIGLVGHFIQSPTGYQHTGVVRDATDGTWKFFSNVKTEPSITVDFTTALYDPIRAGEVTADKATIGGVDLLPYTQASFAHANAAYESQNTTGTYANSAFTAANSAGSYANSAYDQANTATTNAATADSKAVTAGNYANSAFDVANSAALYANGSFVQANAAFNKANSVVQTGFTTIAANGTNITPSSNADTLTITAATANGINVLNPSSKTIDLGLRTSGVTSGTYGGPTNIPVLVVDVFGRVTSAANVSVSTTINLAGGSGSGSVSGGDTLTVSGGTGITTSVSGSTITVTNSGVTSFNGSTGAVTFGSLNVTNALGYTPANRAGDAFTGAVSSSGSITGSSLTANTSVTVNTNGNITSNTFTTGASTAQVTVDSFATTTFRSAKYFVQMTAGSNHHVIELNLVHNGTTVWLAQYGEIFTSASLGTFDANISTGTLILQFTPASATATTVRTVRTAIAV